MKKSPAQRKAEALIAEWQKILRLQDWAIVVEVPEAPLPEEKGGGQGYCEFYSQINQAHIWLCHPRFKPRRTTNLWDLEVTVVHELLHIKFHMMPLNISKAHMDAFESAIDTTAQSFVALKRAGLLAIAAQCADTQRKAA